MLGLYDFNQTAAKQFAGPVSAWEFWNEPDLDSCSNPAWDFATCQKIAYLGFKAGAPGAKVLVGSNAVTPTSKFFEVVLQNSVGAGFDVFNIHLYGSENVLPAAVAEKNQELTRYGMAGKPIWATEVGAAKDEVGNAAPLLGSNREMDATQEITQAEQVVKSLVTLHSLQVKRSFYFLLLPYNENNGTVPWGLIRWDWTVKPGFCALANLTATLAGHDYVGKMNLAGVNAYVLEKRGQAAATRKQTVVFWATGSPVGVVAAWAKGSQLTDLMGTPRALTVNRAGQPFLSAGAAPQFLTNVTPQMTAGAAPPAAAAVPLQPVVLSFAPSDPTLVVNRTALNLGATAAPASLKVWNVSSGARVVSLLNASSGVSIGTLPAAVTVPARQQVTVPLSIARTTAGVTAPMVRISGTSGNMPVAPLVVPVRPGANAFKATVASIWNTAFWRINSGGPLTLLGDKSANTMHFSAQFPSTATRWVFPALVLKSAGLTLSNTAGVSFDTKADGTAVQIQRSYAIVKESSGTAYQIPIWIGTNWTTNTILWNYDAPEDFTPATTIELQIGADVNQAQLGYTVRNVSILTAP